MTGCLKGWRRRSGPSATLASRKSAAQTGRHGPQISLVAARRAAGESQKSVDQQSKDSFFRTCIHAPGPRTLLTFVVAIPLIAIVEDLMPDVLMPVLMISLLVIGLRLEQPLVKICKPGPCALQSVKGSSARITSEPPSQWWPNLLRTDGKWSHEVLSSTMPMSVPSAHCFDGNAPKLLAELQEIIMACRTPAGRVGDMFITPCARNSPHSVSVARKRGCAVGIVCFEFVLNTELPIEAILWALYNVDERLSWDQQTFGEFEVLRAAAPQGFSGALGDVIYCRLPTPTPMKDRDMVQERFLMRLPKCSATPAGGLAIVMQSPSEATACMLGRPPIQEAVRAKSIISGFVLQPQPESGVLFSAVSCTDIGGYVPRWAQALAQKTCVKMSLDMAQRLQHHCNSR